MIKQVVAIVLASGVTGSAQAAVGTYGKGRSLGDALSAPRIAGLDFLRALAVLMVMFSHATEGQQGMGSLGVNLFFVLSGLLITRLLLDEVRLTGRIHLAGFYRRRVARLLPAFYLYLMAGLGILWLRHKPIPWDAVVAAMLYVVNYFQAFNGSPTHFVSHLWSLAVEEQFYIVWPLLAAWLLRRHLNICKSLCLVILAVWCWRWYLTFLTSTSVDYLYRALDTRADGLAVGCLIAVLMHDDTWRKRLDRLINWPAAGFVISALLAAFTLLGDQSRELKYGLAFMVQPFLIGLLILKCVSVASTPGRRWAALFNNRTLVHMGQVSYFMYLFHGLIMYTTQRAVEARTGSFALGLLIAVLLVYLTAALSFRWFESPMRRLISPSRTTAMSPNG
jgi:peptidoglycan/LPS O-acetylase OafA/YrhL